MKDEGNIDAPSKPRTLFDKIWDSHVVERLPDGTCVLYIDRHLVHEVTSPQAFEGLRAGRPAGAPAGRDHRGRRPQHPDRPTAAHGIAEPESRLQVETLERNVAEFGVPYFPVLDARQGIVHIIGPEQGISLPGMTIVCGDSHTSTHGAMGALAFGIGTSEVEHVLATQTLLQKPAQEHAGAGRRHAAASASPAKDIVLAIIGKIGTAGGTGHVIEYAGEAIRALDMAGRMTVCNMSIEAGARAGLIAPDETTFAYIKGRPYRAAGRGVRPRRRLLAHAAVRPGRRIRPSRGSIAAAEIAPMVTWGTNPEAVRADHRRGARSRRGAGRAKRGADAAHARLHGPDAGHEAAGRAGRCRVHRQLHQRPHRGHPRRRRGGARAGKWRRACGRWWCRAPAW